MHIFKNRTVIGVICIIIALIICFGITPLFNRSISQKTEIVRVTKAVASGEQITADMIQSVEVGSYNLPANIFHDTASVVGKYALADLSVGDYILSTHLTDFLDMISKRLEFHYWLFGHYHRNQNIGQNYVLLWEQIVQVL